MLMKYDFNKLEILAASLAKKNRYDDALKIYFFMSDGDPSLDGGYLAKRIAQCYENLQDFHAAKYWYGKAIEENPVVNVDCNNLIESIKKLTNIDYLVSEEE